MTAKFIRIVMVVMIAAPFVEHRDNGRRQAPLALGWSAAAQELPALIERDSGPDLERGRFLAHAVCSSCHIFPEPDLLAKTNWVDGALRMMAPFLGVARVNLDKRPDGKLLKEAGVFPETPWLSRVDWESLVFFYSNSAPASLPFPAKVEARTELFSVRPLLRSPSPPCTSLLQAAGTHGNFFVGDAQTRTLKLVDRSGKVLRECQTDSGPVALTEDGSRLLVTLIGRILPSDELAGQVWQLAESGGGWSITRLLRGLRRPVHNELVDLDQDGRQTMLISCYGNRLGQLSAFARDGGRQWRELTIAEGAGTLRCLAYDWNGDGLPDLTVLRAQGREGADIYINKGHGQFERHVLWDDPPSYGNVYFQLVDFDRDGRPELLVVNGDNGDFNCGTKPYHGLRIFSVNKNLEPELRFRFAMPGAYCARAADFDLDGKTDIAAISFFPDYERAPEQTFVYLHNEGNWKFTPQVIPGLQGRGRWILMDAVDVDGDGDVDLLLGSFVLGPSTVPIPAELRKRWNDEKWAVVLLENQTRKAQGR